MSSEFLFTSESVTAGHPDKLCDQVSDAVVDAYLRRDPAARIITEAAVSGGVLFLSTRFSADATVDVAEVAREVVDDAGYRQGEFTGRDCTVMIDQHALPPDRFPPLDVTALSEAEIDRVRAGNQVNLFGYACRESPTLMPLPISLAHALARRVDQAMSSGLLPYLAPDAKVQVGVVYRDRRPARLHSITFVAAQRPGPVTDPRQLGDDLRQAVVEPALEGWEPGLDDDTEVSVNPEGPVIGGGPMLHAGLTGRKIAIDTYGEFARHGGASLSGKDPLRIDRVGAYAARHAAKQVVAAGLADHCEVHLSYAVGQALPVSVRVHTYGSGRVDQDEIRRRLLDGFDFRPAGIVRRFDLQRLPMRRDGFYRRLAVYGHMGREDLDAPWEDLEGVALLA